MAAVNCATMVVGRWRPSALSAEKAFYAAYPHLKERWTEHAAEPRMLVAAVSPEGQVQSAALPAGKFQVIGRHTQCPLQLEDPHVSLRHLVLHWSVEAEVPLIRLWDLHAGEPFHLEETCSSYDPHIGSAGGSRSVVAQRLLFGSLGRYALLVLPIGPEAPLDNPRYAWESLPERRLVSARQVTERPRLRGEVTITQTLPPVVIGTHPVVGRLAGTVRVEGREGSLECRVSDEYLDRGLLFGRYERCQLSMVGDQRLSRVHLLMVRVGAQLWAVDTASTNGTHRNGAPVSATPLTGPTSLLLGRECLVRWQPAPPDSVA